MRRLLPFLLSLFMLKATSAFAIPIVSVDTDPFMNGVQSELDLILGTSFSIDIVIADVEAASPLAGFEFDLDFDPSVLLAASVIDGGFLLPSFGFLPPFIIEQDLSPPDVNLAETSLGLGAAGAVGSGVLATITFDTIGFGTSVLNLNDVILSAPFGVNIPIAAVNDGQVNAVPEPSTLLLLGSGLAGLLGWHRRRGPRGGNVISV